MLSSGALSSRAPRRPWTLQARDGPAGSGQAPCRRASAKRARAVCLAPHHGGVGAVRGGRLRGGRPWATPCQARAASRPDAWPRLGSTQSYLGARVARAALCPIRPRLLACRRHRRPCLRQQRDQPAPPCAAPRPAHQPPPRGPPAPPRSSVPRRAHPPPPAPCLGPAFPAHTYQASTFGAVMATGLPSLVRLPDASPTRPHVAPRAFAAFPPLAPRALRRSSRTQ